MWQAYRLVYKALSPIHIGWNTLGYIKMTRYYIPGKSIWGAFTANATRTCSKSASVGDYQVFKELFKSSILVSYFFPSIDQVTPLIPCFTNEGLKYGDYYKPKFECLFIRSFGQTAILPNSITAEDGSLHEQEYIAPFIKLENEGQTTDYPVYYIGYLFIKIGAKFQDYTISWDDNNTEIKLKDALSEIFVGGDRKYGWGRLRLEKDNENKANDFFGNDLCLNSDLPEITFKEGKPIPAHIPHSYTLELKGDLEPLIGREWSDKGAGQEVKHFREKVCWVPGSIVIKETKLRLSEYGILEEIKEI